MTTGARQLGIERDEIKNCHKIKLCRLWLAVQALIKNNNTVKCP